MGEKREVVLKKGIKVVTSNNFITDRGLSGVSLKARKLLYLAISQCKKMDEGFYEYDIPVPVFSKLMGIDASNVYQESYVITNELAHTVISVLPEGVKKYSHLPITSLCDYDGKMIRIELNPKMTDLFLHLKGSFSQPLLDDFVRMKSPYSMAIWHLMQREMKSVKPGVFDTIQFDLTLEELRRVTGTEEKLKQLVEFKRRVLDKALREILDNCGTEITYQNIKVGKTVVGFRFTAKMAGFHVDEDKIPKEIKEKVEAGLKRIKEKKDDSAK